LHALAWITTTAEAVLAAARWGLRLAQEGRLAPAESLVLQIAIGEYLAQLASGIAMSQSEVVRPPNWV
jgi:(2S)-methylsuccinyl-CoA dehydrogenase